VTGDRLDVLISPALFPKGPDDTLLDCPDWNWLLDSGAYTNFTSGKEVVTLDSFTDLVRRHEGRVWKYFNLDVIGDHRASMENFAELRGRGLNPVPVFQRGGTAKQLSAMLDDHELIGIGGIAGVLNRTGDKKYLAQIMRVVGNRRNQVHFLGVGALSTIHRYRPFSVDSATMASSRMFGTIQLFDGGRLVPFCKSARNKTSSSYVRPTLERTRVLRSYGLTWSDIGSVGAWKGGGACLVANMVSWIRYVDFIRQKTGVRLFMVDHPAHHEDMKTAWLIEKARRAA
jgi:hypothetical protein